MAIVALVVKGQIVLIAVRTILRQAAAIILPSSEVLPIVLTSDLTAALVGGLAWRLARGGPCEAGPSEGDLRFFIPNPSYVFI